MNLTYHVFSSLCFLLHRWSWLVCCSAFSNNVASFYSIYFRSSTYVSQKQAPELILLWDWCHGEICSLHCKDFCVCLHIYVFACLFLCHDCIRGKWESDAAQDNQPLLWGDSRGSSGRSGVRTQLQDINQLRASELLCHGLYSNQYLLNL